MSEAVRIAIIEDDTQVRELLRVVLKDSGYETAGAGEASAGFDLVKSMPADLVLLDFNLEGDESGLHLCQRIRSDADTASIPIIVLTGEQGEQIELQFLEAGADDYIRKHDFRAPVLLGRIKAVLRRTSQTGSEVVRTEHLVVHPGRREALVDGEPINLTPTEFDILHKLAANPDRALSRRELLDRGDGDGEGVDRTVDVHVLSIRRKLGRHSWLVATVWGMGYRLGTPPQD